MISNRLILKSRYHRNGGEIGEVSISFNWPDFKPGTNIDEIRLRYAESLAPDDKTTGVELILDDTRESWSEQNIVEVYKDLITLVNPFPDLDIRQEKENGKADPGLKVSFDIPEFPSFQGTLSDRFLESSWGILDGRIDKTGQAQFHLRIQKNESKALRPARRFKRLGEVRFKIHFFIYRSELLKGYDFSVGELRNIGREQGGVRIFLDRFRVFPYGDSGDDWLDLDADRGRRLVAMRGELMRIAEKIPRRPMLLLPGNNQLVGAVSISRMKNPNVELNISRERLIENEAFEELKYFVRLGIDWMTLEYARWKYKREGAKGKPGAGVDAINLINQAKEQFEQIREVEPETKQQVRQALDLALRAVESGEEDKISEFQMLRVLASTGTAIVVFNHELRATIDSLNELYDELKRFSRNVEHKHRKKYVNAIKDLLTWADNARSHGEYVGLLLSKKSRQRRMNFALKAEVDKLGKTFRRYMDERHILFENQVPPQLRTPLMFESELQSILLNLHTNALKALRKARFPKIRVAAVQTKEGIKVQFLDTGTGVPNAKREEIFEAFVTTSEPDPVLGAGTGLGLKIVRDLVEMYGGKVRIVDPKAPWKTSVEISLPKE
jgi:signal transduction histidine kinase